MIASALTDCVGVTVFTRADPAICELIQSGAGGEAGASVEEVVRVGAPQVTPSQGGDLGGEAGRRGKGPAKG